MFKPGSTYEVALVRGVICIEDLNEGGKSVTNDAEAVITDLRDRKRVLVDGRGRPRRVIYRDSTGRWDEMVVRDNRFAHFAPIGETDRQAALDKILGEGVVRA